MSNQYNQLVYKIEVFIRKYYKNQLIKGALLSLALISSYFIVLVMLEHFLRLNSVFRAIFFYSYVTSALVILYIYILRPLSGLVRIGRRLSQAEAAKILGNHFPEVRDRLLNTLQLHELLAQSAMEDISLLEAAIEQKSQTLSPVPFSLAIRFSVNKKYLKYILPPILIIVILSWYSPKMISDSSQRIINYDKEFIPESPYTFEIQNSSLSCIQGSDFELVVKIIGEIVPEEVYIVIENYPFKVSKKSAINFTYLFKNNLSSKEFYFKTTDFRSPTYTIEVQPTPKIISFNVNLEYPNYLGKANETLKNAGDFTVPEGTKVSWSFNTKDLNAINMIVGETALLLKDEESWRKSPWQKIRYNTEYQLIPINNFIQNADTLRYAIDVIKDQYPSINLAEYTDSLDEKRIYFQGVIKDDYGFKNLYFKWKKEGQEEAPYQTKSLPIQASYLQQKFYYYIDLDSFKLADGQGIKYYFEVWDNDGVNGSKSAQSLLKNARKSSREELDSARNKMNTEVKKDMEESLQEIKKINKELEKLNKKLVDKQELAWQDKAQLKELMKQYQDLLKQVEEIKKQQEIVHKKNQELNKDDERLIEKQRQLQALFEKLMTPEMKEMMEEMQKMMQEELKKEDAQKMLEKMQLDNKDLEKQLDRDLEIFKQMEFDQKMQDAINKLDSIKADQDKLNQELDNKEIGEEDAVKKQEEIKKEFDDFKKKLDEAEKANKELEKPNSMEDTKPEQQDIEDKINESKEELEKGKSKSASKMQQSASESMEKLSEKLKQMQEEMEEESNAESIEDLKDVLNNLIESSFKQEDLMNEVQVTSNLDPKYPTLIRRQKDLKIDLKMIEDSLMAISKRQPSISPMVNKEISHINLNMDKTMESLLQLNTIGPTSLNQKNMAVGKQQEVMTSINNLAVMLAESLEEMQKQQMEGKGKKGSCKKPKPGQGGSSMKSIREMQQALNKKMKEMQQKMKAGQKPGQQKGGGSKQGNGEKMSEEMARMAAEQELIRQKLQEYQNALKKAGHGKAAQDLNKTAQDMEQNETELVNNMLLQESIMRQEEILTRLLEAEKAEREQKEEETREAIQGKDLERKYPPQIEDFIQKQNKDVELFKTIPPNLKPFYKNKVNNYFERINNL